MKIPFSPPYIDDDIINEVKDVLNSGWITTGPKVRELEDYITNFSQVESCLGVNSATSGLMLAMHWFGIGKGDEVIIPAYTYAATALAVLNLDAKPVMVDSDMNFNMDPNQLKLKITKKTKAVIPVDIGGWPCDYKKIRSIVNEPTIKTKFQPRCKNQEDLGRILILSDAAHSIGAIYKGRPAVNWSDFSIFSFHAVKNITSAEGGMILINMPKPFNNINIYNKLRILSLNGQTKDAYSKTIGSSWRYDIVCRGFKMNMPDVLAAIALIQIKKYKNQLLPERKRVYETYKKGFNKWELALNPLVRDEKSESSYHLYTLRIKGVNESKRDKIINYIMRDGVSVNVHFQPLPLLTLFKKRGYQIKEYPNAFKCYSEEISLPIYPQLTDEQVNLIIKTVIINTEKVLNC